MDTYPIVMTFLEPGALRQIPTAAYEFVFTRWRWIEKACCWLLKRTGCLKPHFDETQIVKQVRIDKDHAAKEIVRIAGNQLMKMTGRRIDKVLVGLPQFHELASGMDGINMWRPIHFELPISGPSQVPSPENRYDSGWTVFDIPVHVIPWMDGVLVLEK